MSIRLRCKKHPRYNGKKSPRASCEGCQAIHDIRNVALAGGIKLYIEVVEK